LTGKRIKHHPYRENGEVGRVPAGLAGAAAAASLGFSFLGAMSMPAFSFPYGDQPTFGVYNPYSNPYSNPYPRQFVPATPRLRHAEVRIPRRFHKHQEPSKGAEPTPAKQQAPKISGPLIIAVSIGSQHLTVYDDGTPIASAPVSTGMKGHLTPMGVFSIIQKEKWHRSNLYSNAPMPYMERITWSGVALHAGVLPGYPASHGCIRMPYDFAVRLWGMTRIGARVVVTRNDAMPFTIEHPRLAALFKKASSETAQVPAPGTAPIAAAPGSVKEASAAGMDVHLPVGVVPSKVLPSSAAAPADRFGFGTALAAAKPPSIAPSPPLPPSSAAPVGGVGAGTVSQMPGSAALAAAGDDGGQLRPAVDGVQPEPPAPPVPVKPAEPTLRPGPISLFVSRKEGKLFVRKGFEPVFDVPVTIARPNEPIGTHIFTAGRPTPGTDALRWIAVSIPNDREAAEPVRAKGRSRDVHEEKPQVPFTGSLRQAAMNALDRIELPPDALERIVPLVTPGASLLISDQGLGPETGKETDFIVVTR
jgi:lipoprotein-anchoring transpeptidase ErfK/SrfK